MTFPIMRRVGLPHHSQWYSPTFKLYIQPAGEQQWINKLNIDQTCRATDTSTHTHSQTTFVSLLVCRTICVCVHVFCTVNAHCMKPFPFWGHGDFQNYSHAFRMHFYTQLLKSERNFTGTNVTFRWDFTSWMNWMKKRRTGSVCDAPLAELFFQYRIKYSPQFGA